uniref:Uncharacterized protein n=1 Tax=Anopheles funestus TaxID=62324 RepID=A0A182S1M5_ANOFN
MCVHEKGKKYTKMQGCNTRFLLVTRCSILGIMKVQSYGQSNDTLFCCGSWGWRMKNTLNNYTVVTKGLRARMVQNFNLEKSTLRSVYLFDVVEHAVRTITNYC